MKWGMSRGEPEQAAEADVLADLDVEPEVAAEASVGLGVGDAGVRGVGIAVRVDVESIPAGRRRCPSRAGRAPDSGSQISLWLAAEEVLLDEHARLDGHALVGRAGSPTRSARRR